MGSHPSIPKGSLIQLPNVPRFVATYDAIKWIRKQSGDLLAGKQVMILRACEIISLEVDTSPRVVINSKPKVTVTDPSRTETSHG